MKSQTSRALGCICCSLLFVLPLAGIEALTISAEKLPIILEETREKVEELQTYGAEEVYAVVKKNLDRMKDLKDLVNQNISINPNERAKKITAILKQMRDDYAAIASQSHKIEEGMEKKLQELNELLRDPQSVIREIEKEKRELAKELGDVPSKETDVLRRTIREQSLKAQLSMIEGELSTWRNFSTLQSAMTKKSEEMKKIVSTFILVLVENARVYDKAHRFAMLNERYHEAVASLDQNYDEMKTLTDKLIESWYELQQVMDEAVKFGINVGKKPTG